MRELNVKEKDLLKRVVKKPELQPFFFRKLKGLHWFDALSDNGFLAPEKNPKPVPAKEEGYVNIPHWSVTEYLVATSQELSSPDNDNYAIKFIELIRKITAYAKIENFSNYRTWWQLAKVIRNIPVHLISLEDIDLVDYWLDDSFERGLLAKELGEIWLPDLLERQDKHSQQLALRLLDCLYKVIFVDNKIGSSEKKEPKLRYDSYYAEKITKKVAKLSGLRLGLSAVELFQGRLVSILDEGDHDTWSSIWRRAIEEHEQNGRLNDADDVILAAYRDCFLGAVDKDLQLAKDYIQVLLKGQYQTLERVAIHALDKRYIELKALVGSVVNPEYFKDNYRHEFWHFLNNHYRELSTDQQNKVVEIIEGLDVTDEGGGVNEKATAYNRSIWLSAIKSFDEKLAQLYETYANVAGAEPEHPDFSSYMTVGWVDHKSPIPIEHLLSLDIGTLVQTIDSYKDTGRSWFGEPGLEGLVKTFKDVVKTKAKDIYRELLKFSNSDLAFIYPLIEAYHELWNEKKELPWNDVWPLLLNFCHDLVTKDRFWSEENAKERSHFVANRHWIVGAIGRLIEDGSKSDEHAFDKSVSAKAKEVLLALLERQNAEEFKLDSDAVLVAINSPRGRCLEGLVNLALRSCRIEHKESGDHAQAWSQYKDIYEAELMRCAHDEYEFVTIVAMYLPNFYYMSSQWVLSHLSDIFNQSNYQQWLCAMQGYSYINNVYEEFYKHLKTNGDFLKAFDDNNLKKQVNEKIIQNIAVAFINDFEDINQPDSLIATLVQRKNLDELRQLIWFIWTLREKNNKKLKEKVFELWPRLLEIVDVTSKEGRVLASILCHWATFVDKIDATVEGWLLKIAPYADEDHNVSELLLSIAEISKIQPVEAQKIWVKMLESYSYDYPEDAIRQIFKNLIALGADGERRAKEIIDAYLRHGIERPRTWLAEIKTTADMKAHS